MYILERTLSRDIPCSLLPSNETVAVLMYQINPVGAERFLYMLHFFCNTCRPALKTTFTF